MKNNDKITMTVGQLKKLVKESKSNKRLVRESELENEYIEKMKKLRRDCQAKLKKIFPGHPLQIKDYFILICTTQNNDFGGPNCIAVHYDPNYKDLETLDMTDFSLSINPATRGEFNLLDRNDTRNLYFSLVGEIIEKADEIKNVLEDYYFARQELRDDYSNRGLDYYLQ